MVHIFNKSIFEMPIFTHVQKNKIKKIINKFKMYFNIIFHLKVTVLGYFTNVVPLCRCWCVTWTLIHDVERSFMTYSGEIVCFFRSVLERFWTLLECWPFPKLNTTLKTITRNGVSTAFRRLHLLYAWYFHEKR